MGFCCKTEVTMKMIDIGIYDNYAIILLLQYHE